MTITYAHAGTFASLPKNDDIADYAAKVYSHVLNTPERRNKPHNGPAFAEAIAEVYDVAQPHNAAIVAHLKSLP